MEIMILRLIEGGVMLFQRGDGFFEEKNCRIAKKEIIDLSLIPSIP
jgi:hypothetical protein